MAFRFIFNNKILALPSGKLGGAGLFGVEMIKAGFARKNFPVLGDF